MPAATPWAETWQLMQAGATLSGAKTWHVRQFIGTATLLGWVSAVSFSWQRAQGAIPGSLNPSFS
jgi:hypothetical protein